MSSIIADDLIIILERYPDYEVIMKTRTKYDVPAGESIAYINGYEINDDFKEIYLCN